MEKIIHGRKLVLEFDAKTNCYVVLDGSDCPCRDHSDRKVQNGSGCMIGAKIPACFVDENRE